MGGKSWEEYEDQYIKDNYYINTAINMSKNLNRTVASIRHRISELNLDNKRIPVSITIGQKINRLTLIKEYLKDGIRFGEFICECENNIVQASIWSVFHNKIRSCGCIKKEKDSARFRDMNYKHGMSDTVEHNTWMSVKNRCYNNNNKEYKSYGGRGVKMSDEWLDSFQMFYNDMGPKPEPKYKYHIGRKDHYDSYYKENCRWITNEEESIDNDNNRFLIAFGDIKTLLHWCKDDRCLCDMYILKYRLYDLAWSPEKSLTTVVYEG